MRASPAFRWPGALAALVLLAGAAPGLGAQQRPEPGTRSPPPGVTLHGRVTDHDPFDPAAGVRSFPVTVHLKGAAGRIDFAGRHGERGMLLEGGDGQRWLVALDRAIAVPVRGPALAALQRDPAHPCAGMKGRCEPVRARYIAGVSAPGWRYRGAAGTGPAGTSDGQFWIEPTHGAVLAWDGRKSGRDDRFGFEAERIAPAALPDAMFELPDVPTLPAGGRP